VARRLPPGAALALSIATGAAARAAAGGDDALPPALVAEALAGRPCERRPGGDRRPRVVALVRLAEGGEPALLRLDLPATSLAAERRVLARLTPLVVGLSSPPRCSSSSSSAPDAAVRGGAGASARRGRRRGRRRARDELEFLLSTFDRALAPRSAPRRRPGAARRLARSLARRRLPAARSRAARAGHDAGGGGAARCHRARPPARRSTARSPPRPRLAPGSPRRSIRRRLPLPSAPCGCPATERDRVIGFTAEPLRGEGGLRGWLVVLADRTERARRAKRASGSPTGWRSWASSRPASRTSCGTGWPR
jgi:hypothetical protein